ncbi:hypothetical protein DYB25_008924 [Aphanomyces astaci]|uniref:DDT domain-containing protein n=1 Tax=Aphanomyces astaci TaxID=112090 RepID=A0A397B4H4_APHAT|nr:hypothetical protein DYB25_008924 [Aphanomyces astaci]
MKDQKRHQREEEKRQRDLVREAKMREKDEALARRSAKALEDKTKRVLDMKERIVKKQKVTYKDREEEKLGKIAENSAESIRQAKEKLEKLEKEDLLLKRKEQALAKSRRQADPDEVADLAGPLPEAKPCHFGGIPSNMFRQVLSAWDFVVSFQNAVGISAMTIDQLCAALVSPKFCPLVNELHMCLLDLILESREVDTSVSEEDAEMDPLDRYRFEVAHAPLTVGVPTSNMLNVLSWPAVLANLITAVPRYFNNASPAIKAAVAALRETEYPQLLLHHKIALLDLLVALAYSTDKIGRIVNLHVQERTDASKEHNRLLFQEKRDKAEENKRLVEQQKADKAKLASEQKVAMQNWLKGGKMGAAPVVDEAVSQSPLDDDATSATQSDDSDNSSDEDDEELKSLQAKGIISRQEYLARKKKRDMERDARRKHKEERARRTKQKEQLLKKRALVIEELNLAMEMRDLNRLHMSLKAAKENGMHTLKKPKLSTTGVFVAATPQDVKLYEDAVEFADRLEADAAKEHEMDERKQAFDKAMREFFIRTQSLGKDSHRSKYWLFRGDAKRMYVEHVDGKWSYYDSPSSVQQLMDALPEGHPLKKELVPHVDTLVKEMNKAVAPSSTDDWENKAKTWGSSTLYDLTLDEVKKELLQVQAAVTTRLVNARGTMWVHIDQSEWSENVAAATSISGLVNAVLALEREVSDDKGQYKVEEDEDDEEEDETFVQNSLWPSKKCRDRWIAVVTQCQTLSNVALSLASLVQRMDIWTLTGGGGAAKKDAKAKRELKRADEDGGDGGSEVSPTKPKRLPPPSTHPPEREWEEYCCICKDGGDLLCWYEL